MTYHVQYTSNSRFHCPSASSGSAQKRKNQQQKQPPRKLFDDYWDKERVQQGLKRGELVQGALRINPKNYMDAYVPHPVSTTSTSQLLFIAGRFLAFYNVSKCTFSLRFHLSSFLPSRLMSILSLRRDAS